MRCVLEKIGDNLYECWCGQRFVCGKPELLKRLSTPCKGGTSLGDKVAKALSLVGVTKRRWSRTLVYFRLQSPGAGCGCAKRQQQLNRLGDGLLRWWQAR